MPQEGCTEQKKLMGGVLVLLPATAFTKVVGLLYKIPLIAIVGVEGMAYFLAAYHLYSALFVLCATGLPTALALQLAGAVARGRRCWVRRIFGVALALFFSLGMAGALLLWRGAPWLAQRLSMSDAVAAIRAIAPALLLSSYLGAAKGYFQGFHHMLPTALCEVLESAGKLVFGLGFALLARGRGLEAPAVAAYAIFGITAGLAVAAVMMTVLLLTDALRSRGRQPVLCLPSHRTLLKELLWVGLPITVSSSVMSLVTLIDTALISGRLQAAGFAPAIAHAMYSSYGNLALPLYNLVPALLTPITLSLMPLLGGALSRGDREGGRLALGSALRLTALISIPAALGLGVFARPILALIYAGQGAAVDLAAPLLSLLALAVVPTAMISLTGAALQAIGRTFTPLWAMGVGAVIKLGVEVLLLPVAGVHLYAAPISTLLCNLVVLLIQAIALARALPFSAFTSRALFASLLAAMMGVGGGAMLYFAMLCRVDNAFGVLPAILFAGLTFLLCALRWGAVQKQDLLALPAGKQLCSFLSRYKFIKWDVENES